MYFESSKIESYIFVTVPIALPLACTFYWQKDVFMGKGANRPKSSPSLPYDYFTAVHFMEALPGL